MTVGAIVRDEQSAEFFDAAARGELLVRQCRLCGHHNELSHPLCTECGSPDLAWVQATGEGTLVSWTIIPPGRGAEEGAAPTVVALVELSEGPWLWAQLPGVDLGRLSLGAALSVGFVHPDGGEAVPVFTLA